jgi:low affinity Fe/Cu permease
MDSWITFSFIDNHKYKAIVNICKKWMFIIWMFVIFWIFMYLWAVAVTFQLSAEKKISLNQ